MRVILTAVLVLVMLSAFAWAQDTGLDNAYYALDSDMEYVDGYFGTKLIIFVTEPIDYNSWWGEVLPDEFNNNASVLINMLNLERREAGRQQLDPMSFHFTTGWDEETDGGWEYPLEFRHMTPAEALMVIEEIGGLDHIFPNGQFSFVPLRSGTFDMAATGLDGEFVLELGSTTTKFPVTMPMDEMYREIDAAFQNHYGKPVSIQVSYYCYAYGPDNIEPSLTVNAEITE